VKNRFQNLPFKRNLQRYTTAAAEEEEAAAEEKARLAQLQLEQATTTAAGLCALESS
jgi:hypothetical protein